MSLQILNTFKDGDCMDSLTCSRVCAHSTSLLPREMFSLTFKWNFLYFSSCHFHLSLDTTEDVLYTARWLHLLYFISSNIYTHEQHFPELSLLRDEYFPQFLLVCQVLQHLTHHCCPLLDWLQHVHVSALLRSPALAQLSWRFPQCWMKVESHLWSAGTASGRDGEQQM